MTKQADARQDAPVLVHPLMEGMRLVKIHGRSAGKARSLEDLKKFLDQAGLRDVDVDNPAIVEWHGGGSGVWNV
jgi:hypothetical protein